VKRKRLWLWAAAGVGLYLLLRPKKAAAASPPVVAGTITVGGKTLVIDDNVLNDQFSTPIQPN